MVRGFEVFGKLVVAVVTVGLAAAIVEALTGFVIIPGMAPISDGFETVAPSLSFWRGRSRWCS